MPPKFKRHVDSYDYVSSKDTERANLLEDGSDEEDFFLKGPNAKPSKLNVRNNKIDRVQGQVNEVVGVMQNNIDKVLDRGERLEDLQDKSEDLSSNADIFRSRSKGLKNTMWWKNCRMKIILALIILIILAIIIIPIVIKTQKK